MRRKGEFMVWSFSVFAPADQRIRRFSTVFFCCQIVLAFATDRTQGRLQSFDETVMGSPSQTKELIERVASEVIGGKEETLIELIEASDDSLAVAAAWEKVVQEIRLDPGAFENHKSKPRIREFIDLLESKIEVQAPTHWKRMLETCSYSGESGTVDFEKWQRGAFRSNISFYLPEDVSMRLRGGAVFAEKDGVETQMHSFEYWASKCGYKYFDVCRIQDFDCVVFFSEAHLRCPLECWIKSSGELLWRTRIVDYPFGNGGSIVGGGTEWIELVANQTNLFVFGMNLNGHFYVEALTLGDGVKTFMFYPELWEFKARGMNLTDFDK
jgi:hypothetical protein